MPGLDFSREWWRLAEEFNESMMEAVRALLLGVGEDPEREDS